ncbi:helix-turn-helix domain-containing protein [Nocardiopsis halophila]|uniref:helix-turn-helix domain-containing protein n=1 Tax=Nocardiopsis halophila TaxID=141692 RepID=UPI000A075066|nr:helix-turn-helix domain-containing protein [Nocardiopsis halophila]
MSGQRFARVFRKETGSGPAAYVESVRVEAARRLLESTDIPLGRVAALCGLGTVEALRRVVRRRTGSAPEAYRRSYRTAP